MNFIRKFNINYKLLGIFLLALFLRLWGITYGFPHIWSIDEPALVRSSYGLRFNLNPGHFDWPHFYYYVNGIFYFILYSFRVVVNRIGLGDELQSIFPLLYKDPTVFYFISRVLNAIVGALTSIVMFKVSKNLFSTKIALLSALLMAIMPYHVQESHKALLEPALVLTMLLVFYYSIKIIDKPTLKHYILAGIFIGLSTSIKYNGFLSAIPLVLATIFVILSGAKNLVFRNQLIKFLLVSGILSIITFFLTTPYAMIDYQTFIRSDISSGAFWQFENIGKNPINEFLPNLYSTLSERIPEAVTFLVWLTCLIGFYMAVKNKNAKIVILGLFMFAYILNTNQFTRQPTHYFLPIFTIIVLLSSYFFNEFLEINKNSKYSKILITLVILFSFFHSVKVSILFANTDTRNLATDYISENIKSGVVLFDGEYKPLILDKKILLKSPPTLIYDSIIKDINPDYFIWTKYNGVPQDESYFKYLSGKIEKVIYFSKRGNLGPDIYIYKLIK